MNMGQMTNGNCNLLVCSQGKAMDVTSFPAEGTEPDNCI